jgi:hypothetical protein
MKRWSLLIVSLQLAPTAPSLAQEASSCDGIWRYTHLDKARGWPAEVKVRISGDRGTYFARLGSHKAKNSPCRDRDLPLDVELCTASELVFKVRGEDVADGCPAFTARFTFTGPDAAEAAIGRGEVVQAHRER